MSAPFELVGVQATNTGILNALNQLLLQLRVFVVSGGRSLTINSGAQIVTDGESYAGAHSYQPIAPDLNLGAAVGSTADNPKFLSPGMGNIIGDTLTKQGAYLGGWIGAYSITGVKATLWPSGGVLGIVMDGVTDVDGAVVAHLDGDSAQTIANAAFKASMKNTTPGSGFNYGMDLYQAASAPWPALTINKATLRSAKEVCFLEAATTPDATIGANFAGKGSQCVALDTGVTYINKGTKAVPDWKAITTA